MEIDSISVEEKRADATTQLGVDEAILDYLAYKATKAVLRDFRKSRCASVQETAKPRCGLQLDLVDCELLPTKCVLLDKFSQMSRSLSCHLPYDPWRL